MFIRFRFLAVLILAILVQIGNAQEKQFVAEMEATLTIHDTASSVTSEIQALDAFRKLTKKYENEWLPSYWAAYLCTQIARLKGRAPDFPKELSEKELVREAQTHFDHANKNLPDKTLVQQSDFHVLQGFIYGWMEWLVAAGEQEKEKYRKMKKQEYKAAARSNPNNPLLFVLFGIEMTQKERSEKEPYKDVLAGLALMNYADEIFSKAPRRSMTTYWNKDFLPFWKSRAEKSLRGLLEENGS